MLSVPGVDHHNYAERMLGDGPAPQVTCPDRGCAGRLLVAHATYERYLGGALFTVLRVRCPGCGVTHAALPEDVCAYRDALLPAVEAALQAIEAHHRPIDGARAAGEQGPGATRRVRRWHRGLDARIASVIVALLPAAPGAWLERARSALGEGAGALVRLRHWLWSRYALFFGGPAGLYRHGRPRHAVRRLSTDLGSHAPAPARDRPP